MMLGACGNSASNAGSTEANDSTTATSGDSIGIADETIVTVETVKFEKNDSTRRGFHLGAMAHGGQ